MASADILSQTLSSITDIKLDELSVQRRNFDNEKREIIRAVRDEPDQREKVRLLLDKMDDMSSAGKIKENPLISRENIRQYLHQANHDPSVAEGLQRDWQTKLEEELHINSLKYEYASLYGQLVNEWISASDRAEGDSSSTDGSSFEDIGRKEMHEQRAKWEEYVFNARETDPDAIKKYLERLFNSTTPIKQAYKKLRKSTEDFGTNLAGMGHFDTDNLKPVISSLLRSDLLSDEKRKVLKDILNNHVVLDEVADVLNMRMQSLDKWNWDPRGTNVEQRRQLNGRYRFYHDEDLLQTILLRYIGVEWSLHFKSALRRFHKTQDVWKPLCAPVPAAERQRREYFLGELANASQSVESRRQRHFQDEIFLEQLPNRRDEQRGGYDSDSALNDTRKSGVQITQSVLHTLATEIIMKTRLGDEVCAVRSDFAWFGPSLPHSTMFAVLKFFNVSDRWISFFRRALEAPMKFVEDGPDGAVRTRKRGTPVSGPLSDMLGETVLFCLDFAFNLGTGGARLYRLHDDIWFWGSEKTCVAGWSIMKEFAEIMGLDFNEEKTGSVRIAKNNGKAKALPSSLPKGDVSWGFLKLDAATGRFLIDEGRVDIHVGELRRQLAACKSVFDWIQAWNIYGARFFTNNFGRTANCFGRAHVDVMLKTFGQIQSKLFASTGGSVTLTLKKMLTDRFGVQDIPEGYLYLPTSMGGLDLKSPFVDLYLIRDTVNSNPDEQMDKFFEQEEAAYRLAKSNFDRGMVPRAAGGALELKSDLRDEQFMSMEEFSRYREQTSTELQTAYENLMKEPDLGEVIETSDVFGVLDAADTLSVQNRNRGSYRRRGVTPARGGSTTRRNSAGWLSLTPYERWIVQLYASDMIRRFGGLNVVERGLLPTGMVHMFRESRFKWQG